MTATEDLKGFLFVTLVFGGLPAVVAYIAIAVGVVGAAIAFPWSNRDARPMTSSATALAAPPLTAFVWVHALQAVAQQDSNGAPAWFTDALWATFTVACGLAAWLVARARRVRAFVALAGAAATASTYLVTINAILSANRYL